MNTCIQCEKFHVWNVHPAHQQFMLVNYLSSLNNLSKASETSLVVSVVPVFVVSVVVAATLLFVSDVVLSEILSLYHLNTQIYVSLILYILPPY